jgi:hypothetical protein
MIETLRKFANGGLFGKILLSVASTLLAAGVGALWQMTNHLAALEERVALWQRNFSEQVLQLTTKDVEYHREALGVRESAFREIAEIRERLRQNDVLTGKIDARIDALERFVPRRPPPEEQHNK